MRRFLTSRLFRAAVCLILVCCILFSNASVHVYATGAGALIPTFTGIATVSVPVLPVAIAGLVALGVYAGTQSGFFGDVARSASDWLEGDGLAANGAVEIIQAGTADGQKFFYVAGDLLNSLRSWALGSGTVLEVAGVHSAGSAYTMPGEGKTYTPKVAYKTFNCKATISNSTKCLQG